MTAAPSSAIDRAAIVAEARFWIGTPYRHQASLRGVGADCLGLVRGVWRVLYGPEPEPMPAYSPHWAEESGDETLRDTARRHLIEIDPRDAAAGDVLLFRMRERGPAKHAGIMSGPDRMIHAYDPHAVMETAIPAGWRRRLAYAFSFPMR